MKNIFKTITLSAICALIISIYQPVVAVSDPPNIIYLPAILRDYDPYWQFGDPVKVPIQPAAFSTPYIIVDSMGRPHILLDAFGGEKTFLYHTYLTEQGWSAAAPIAQTLGRSQLLHPPVAGKQNDIHLVWYNALNFGGPYRILYAKWNGVSWEPEIELLGDGKSIYIDGMVRLDPSGALHVAYVDTDGLFYTRIYYQVWNGNAFSAREIVERPKNGSNIWLDTTGGIHFFGDVYPDTVLYSYWKEGAFRQLETAVPGKLNYRKGFLDALNNYHLVQTKSIPVPGGNVNGVTHQCLTSDLRWTAEQVLSGPANVNSSAFAFDDRMQYITAWSQENHQTVTAYLWDGCENSGKRQIALPAVDDRYGWGEFLGIAKNAQAGKLCLLSKEKYRSDRVLVICSR